jgi:hypothetical protein
MLGDFLIEVKIIRTLEKAKVPEDDFDDRHEIFDLYNRKKKIEEVKMLREVREPLFDLDKCSLHELVAIVEKFSKDHSININQAGFGSYIANYVIKEKIQ